MPPALPASRRPAVPLAAAARPREPPPREQPRQASDPVSPPTNGQAGLASTSPRIGAVAKVRAVGGSTFSSTPAATRVPARRAEPGTAVGGSVVSPVTGPLAAARRAAVPHGAAAAAQEPAVASASHWASAFAASPAQQPPLSPAGSGGVRGSVRVAPQQRAQGASVEAAAPVAAAPAAKSEWLASGWLRKRAATSPGTWRVRWCILTATELMDFKDAALREKTGSVRIHPATRAVRVSALSDARRLKADKPYSFVVETGSELGSGRGSIGSKKGDSSDMYDAGDAETLEFWLRTIAKASKGDAVAAAPASPSPSPSARTGQEYLDAHGVPALLAEWHTTLAEVQPEDPLAWLEAAVRRRREEQASPRGACPPLEPCSPLSVGARALARREGRYYHEAELAGDFLGPLRLGWLSERFGEGGASGAGVGDDDHGWAVSGRDSTWWHGGAVRLAPWWPRPWQPNDVVGMAVDIDGGAVSLSLNGEWLHCEAARLDAGGAAVFPAASGPGGFRLLLSRDSWRFAPPGAAFRPWAAACGAAPAPGAAPGPGLGAPGAAEDPAWAGALLGYARGAGVRFVRAGWLRGQLRARAAAGAAGWPGLPRLQDLPAAGALVTHEELWRCLQLERQPLVVSHPWLSAVHPDPEGVQLERICGFLDGAEGWVDADGPVRVPDDHPVFLDWCCLPQHDGRHPDIAALQALGPDARRAELLRLAAAGHGAALAPGEQAALAAALQGFHALFGSDHTKVLCLDGAVPKGAANTVPYLRRGWCLLEQLLARRSAGGFACEAVGPGATPEAPVPLTPELFRAALEGLHFGGGVGDREAVALLYERAFAARAAAGELLLRGLRGAADVEPLRAALLALPAVQHAFVDGSSLGVQGAELLAAALPAAAGLRTLDLGACGLGDRGAEALASRLRAAPLPGLQVLHVADAALGDGAAAAVAALLQAGALPSLLELGLDGGDLGDAGAKAVARALPASLEALFLAGGAVGDAGGAAVAAALAGGAAPRLTQLGLRCPRLADGAARELAAALGGGAAPSLRRLQLHGCGVGGDGRAALLEKLGGGAAPRLEWLSLPKRAQDAGGGPPCKLAAEVCYL